jgi:hypothetical protein
MATFTMKGTFDNPLRLRAQALRFETIDIRPVTKFARVNLWIAKDVANAPVT